MIVRYKSKKLEKNCTDFSSSQRVYGKEMAKMIHMRIDQILATESVETLVKYAIGRCHRLLGNRDGEYAMDLIQPYRLIFEVNRTEIRIAKILCIEDYH